MKYTRKLTFVSILLLAFIFNIYLAAEAEKVTFTGKVINVEGEPVESVKVGFYKVSVTSGETSYQATLDKEVQTDKEGKFEYTTEKDTLNNTQVTIIYAQKEGFGLGWADWEVQRSGNIEIQLQPAAPVAGIVVDESDKPVADANVCLAFLMVKTDDQPQIALGEIMPDKLITKTDEQGKFAFDNIPENAQFDFSVKKPGRATTVTMDMEKFQNSQTLGFSAGQTDIKIVQPVEASIEGIVIEKNTGKPVSGVQVELRQSSELSLLYGFKPIVPAEDGTFRFNGLPAKKFTLLPVAPDDKASEWVSKPVEVTTEVGKTTSGVKIELGKGGLLEVLVKDAQNKQTIKNVNVTVQIPEKNTNAGAQTNENGIAQIRLAPGQYKIIILHKLGYKQTVLQEVIEIENNKTRHMELSLEPYAKISGTVLDENNKPVAGAIVNINPPTAVMTKTDRNGKFTLTEQESGFYDDAGIPYIIVRDKEHNLAAAVELYDKKENLEIKLSKGIIISGKVIDSNDNEIQNPKIEFIVWTSNTGISSNDLVEIDKRGHFKIKSLPPGIRYSVSAQANGYGRVSAEVQTSQTQGEIVELAPIVLKPANMSVSGIVVDIDGKPVANAEVQCYGSGQPNQRTRSDNDGKFNLEKVCEGDIRLQANTTMQGTHLYGNVRAFGGDKDIQIVISESGSSRTVQPRPVSQLGKTLPDMSSLLAEFKPEMIQGKSVLVCFWDYEQRPSRNCIMQLNKRVQELKEKDIVVIAIQASKIEQKYLDEWLNEYSVNFPVGMIGTGEEKTRINWGVKALPWLILTDKEHIVTAEGFTIAELEEHIK